MSSKFQQFMLQSAKSETHEEGGPSGGKDGPTASAAVVSVDKGGAGEGEVVGGNQWSQWPQPSRVIRVARTSGGKDRHSKVFSAAGPRDRRVRLSVTTAIQFFDLQDRLGYDTPSKAVDWLLKTSADAINNLPPLSSSLNCPPSPCVDIDGVANAHQVFDEMPLRTSREHREKAMVKKQNLVSPMGASSSSVIEEEGIVDSPSSSVFLEAHQCAFPGCTNVAKVKTMFCRVHDGGKRCAFPGCRKSVHRPSGFCVGHGGGKRCTFLGCTKFSHGSSSFCITHSAGKRCSFPCCTRSKRGLSDFCVLHGGGKRCSFLGCVKGTHGTSEFCVRHGDQRWCKFKNCRKRSHGGTNFCKAHGKFDRAKKSDLCAAKSSMENTPTKQMVESKVQTEMMDYELDGKTLGSGEMFQEHAALLYCSLFPEEYEFEKDMLIQLWIAGGFIKEEPLEYSASQCFVKFQVLGYIHHSRMDLVTGKMLYKFNRHNLSGLLSGGNHIIIDSNLNTTDHLSTETSHVSVQCSSQIDATTLGVFKRFKQLKTLLFLHGHKSSFKQVPRDLFLSLEHLQVLDLSRTHIAEVPNSIAKMKSLRFLDLSQTPIRHLPETIDHLNNLQTLRLKGCSNLSMLPKGMRKLVNLRHLDLDVLRQLHSMPKGMGALTQLQTLSAFLVGREGECSIGQLRNMNNLTGSFCISRLENVLSEEDAIEACFCNKSRLLKLELRWSDSRDGDHIEDGKILSSLQPNSSLEELRIVWYGGFEIPSWICDPAFSRLVSITIFECENCLILPSLGQLPALKVLNMVEFHKLKVIDHNFRGGVGIRGYIAFPKLEKLTVENMFSLEEWTGTGLSDFPCLIKLTVKNCPKLYSLCTLSCLCSLKSLEISHCIGLTCPDGKLPASVETFIIEDCPLISSGFVNDRGEDWSKVAHVPNVWVDHQERSFGQIS